MSICRAPVVHFAFHCFASANGTATSSSNGDKILQVHQHWSNNTLFRAVLTPEIQVSFVRQGQDMCVSPSNLYQWKVSKLLPKNTSGSWRLNHRFNAANKRNLEWNNLCLLWIISETLTVTPWPHLENSHHVTASISWPTALKVKNQWYKLDVRCLPYPKQKSSIHCKQHVKFGLQIRSAQRFLRGQSHRYHVRFLAARSDCFPMQIHPPQRSRLKYGSDHRQFGSLVVSRNRRFPGTGIWALWSPLSLPHKCAPIDRLDIPLWGQLCGSFRSLWLNRNNW